MTTNSNSDQSGCLAKERQRIICEKALREGQVFIAQLAAEFSVSLETIRRDITYLNKMNVLHKVHGGAIPVIKNLHEEGYEQRALINTKQKEAIGRYAAECIKDNDVVAFDSGVTLDWLARCVQSVNNITIIINSISALNILQKKHNNGDFTGKIIFLGGEVHCQNYYTLGGITTELLGRFHVDKAFVSATSISINGLRMYDISDGMFTATLVKQAATSYLLAESSKFSKEAFYQICGFQDIQHIITDNQVTIPTPLERAMCSAGVELHIVEVGV